MRLLVALALALSLVAPTTLFAQKPTKQKGKPQDSQVTVVFSDTQREAARLYFVEDHGRGCLLQAPRLMLSVPPRARRGTCVRGKAVTLRFRGVACWGGE